MKVSDATRALVERRLSAEVGRIDKRAPARVALTYPSPYSVAMSSLGYQRIYQAIQEQVGVCAERVFLPDGGDKPGAAPIGMPFSYESKTLLSEFPVIAVSVAYELELAGLTRLLDAAGLSPLASDRRPSDPFVLAGGPLTFSNPLPLGVLADAIVVGEGEEVVGRALDVIFGASSKAAAVNALANEPGVYVPEAHGDRLPALARVPDDRLPATSVIVTPHTELSNMFLIETERGCSRGCTYCVMRRTTNGGMRIVDENVVLDAIPVAAKKVGLVGAAVSDHPRIVRIVDALAERGSTVGLSSLRPDRLKLEFVAALRRAGYRTLTTALDGASERLRDAIGRRGRAPHYRAAAEHAREVGMDRLKLYLMLGLPGETDDDVDECVDFVTELSRVVPVALGIAPFCSKRNTPLDGQTFAGIDVVGGRLDRLRRGLRGRADVRSASAKWAWVEYVLAQGGMREGRALVDAVRRGGRFADYRRAFEALGYASNGPTEPLPIRPLPTSRRSLAVAMP